MRYRIVAAAMAALASFIITPCHGVPFINFAPVASFTTSPNPGTYGYNLTLDASSSFDPNAANGDFITSYKFDFNNDGVTDLSATTPVVIVPGTTLPLLGIGYGGYTFRLTVTDTFGATGSATSFHQIFARPRTVDDLYTTQENSAVTMRVWQNDGNPFPVSYALASSPLHGTLSGNLAGDLLYSPNPSFVGHDSFFYLALNPDGVRSAGQVEIEVTAAAAVPIPAALPLFATGFGALSLLARRRKRQMQSSSRATKVYGARTMLTVAACVAFYGLMQTSSFAVTYDLQTQWSDATNPNGAWTYRQGANALPSVPDWRGWGSAWATGTNEGNYLPAFFQYDGGGPFSALTGDILMHSIDAANGNPGLGEGNVIFTSPIAGIATISGKVWDAQQVGRTQDWQVLVNNAVMAGGTFDGTNNRNNPDTFNLVMALAANDVIELATVRHLFGAGNLNGIDLTIEFTAIPITASLPLFVTGLAGLGFLARRRMSLVPNKEHDR